MNKFERGQIVARGDERENRYGLVLSVARILDKSDAREHDHATVLWFVDSTQSTVIDEEVAVVAKSLGDFVDQSRDRWVEMGSQQENGLWLAKMRDFGRDAMRWARDNDVERDVKELLEKHGIPANQRVKAFVTLTVEIDADYVGDFTAPGSYTDREFMHQSLKHLEGSEANVFLDDDWENQHLKVTAVSVDRVDQAEPQQDY